ncbi:MAG: hypothetical protein AB1428_00335 [Bacteroidota bacterium]
MTAESDGRAVRVRIVVALLLAVAALLLTGAQQSGTIQNRPESVEERRKSVAAITSAVDTLLAHYGVDRSAGTVWRPKAAGRSTGRIEQRFTVDPSFLSISFNHDLNLLLTPLGARVVATERGKEQIITMHIVRGGTTVRSITFTVATAH